MSVFLYSTYKDFLRGFIAENRQKGLISKMAAYCGCDRTYLSQVLNGKADLTPDHMIQLCDQLGFSDTEARYLMLLLLRDRASSAAARQSFQQKIDHLKKATLALTNKIRSREQPHEIESNQRTLYFSNWHFAAVHILTSIPAYQSSAAVAAKLNMDLGTVTSVLKELVAMGLVKRDKDRFIHSGADIYLPRQCSETYSHHMGWRMRAVERTMNAHDVHYTHVFSVSKNDVEKLRALLMDMIEQQRVKVRASGTDVACVLCCDFFAL